MITYLVKRRNAWTPDGFLAGWGRDLAAWFRVVAYEDLGATAEIPAGVCIFSDVDQLSVAEAAVAGELRRQLLASGRVRPLNDPQRSLHRLELLSLLHRQGINNFRAYRVTETRRPPRFPVFLRYEDEHWGAISGLLRDQRELDRALASACILHRRPRQLLIVEYCDTRGADGLHRKYSAFLVDGRAVPRDLIFDHGWLQKDIAVVTPATIAEERLYLETNPHEDALVAVAELAGIDYGRIDYGFADGELQVWEINTNPVITKEPHEYRGDHVGNQAFFAAGMVRRLEELAAAVPDGAEPVPVDLPQPATPRRRTLAGAVHLRTWDTLAALGHSRPAQPIVRGLERGIGAVHRPLQPYVALRLRA